MVGNLKSKRTTYLLYIYIFTFQMLKDCVHLFYVLYLIKLLKVDKCKIYNYLKQQNICWFNIFKRNKKSYVFYKNLVPIWFSLTV